MASFWELIDMMIERPVNMLERDDLEHGDERTGSFQPSHEEKGVDVTNLISPINADLWVTEDVDLVHPNAGREMKKKP